MCVCGDKYKLSWTFRPRRRSSRSSIRTYVLYVIPALSNLIRDNHRRSHSTHLAGATVYVLRLSRTITVQIMLSTLARSLTNGSMSNRCASIASNPSTHLSGAITRNPLAGQLRGGDHVDDAIQVFRLINFGDCDRHSYTNTQCELYLCICVMSPRMR